MSETAIVSLAASESKPALISRLAGRASPTTLPTTTHPVRAVAEVQDFVTVLATAAKSQQKKNPWWKVHMGTRLCHTTN